MEKVRVVFFADILISDFDGASRTMFQLIGKIPADRFDFLFVCGLGPERIRGFRCMHINTPGVPGNRSYRFATPLLQKAELDRALQAFSPDVIHISTPSLLGNYALRAAGRLGVPVISIYHTHFISYVDYYVKTFPFLVDFAKQRVRDVLRSFYNQCDTVYVPLRCTSANRYPGKPSTAQKLTGNGRTGCSSWRPACRTGRDCFSSKNAAAFTPSAATFGT